MSELVTTVSVADVVADPSELLTVTVMTEPLSLSATGPTESVGLLPPTGEPSTNHW